MSIEHLLSLNELTFMQWQGKGCRIEDDIYSICIVLHLLVLNFCALEIVLYKPDTKKESTNFSFRQTVKQSILKQAQIKYHSSIFFSLARVTSTALTADIEDDITATTFMTGNVHRHLYSHCLKKRVRLRYMMETWS